MLATVAMEPVETVSAASVRGHIWRGLESVNAFLQFSYTLSDFHVISVV